MIRLVLYFLFVGLVAAGLTWLADQPGTLVVNWQGLEIETSVFAAVVLLLAVVALAVLAWALIRGLLSSPAALSRLVTRKRQKQGLEAVSGGMIAIGSGDKILATRFAQQAARSLPNEPLTALLRAQAAQLAGDRGTARRIYESMLHSPETELLGLRGLYLEADREKETTAARQFAERAMKRNAKAQWAGQALFDLQCKGADWAGAIETLAALRRHEHIDRKTGERWRAVLLTAQAMAAEERDIDKAQALALEAHDLAPDLVPAAEIAGRALAARGKMAKAASVIEQTWRRSPHPDLALVYAHARTGDSPRDRLQRVQRLAALVPGHREGRLALAAAAIEAHDWALARQMVEPMAESDLSARVCVLVARIEGGERGDTGRVREWLARAVHAPRDAAWAADGHVSEHWAAVSLVTGKLDAYRWLVTPDHRGKDGAALLLEELVPLVAGPEAVIEGKASEPTVVERRAESKESPGWAAAEPPVLPLAAAAMTSPTRLTARDGTPIRLEPSGMRVAALAEPAGGAAAPRFHAVAEADVVVSPPQQAVVPDGERQGADGQGGRTPAAGGRAAADTHVAPSHGGRSNDGRPAEARPAATATKPPAATPPPAAAPRPNEPQFFTPSHAPDDPGPEASEIGLLPTR